MRKVHRDSPFSYKAILTLSQRDGQTKLERKKREKAEEAARKTGKTRTTPRSQPSGLRAHHSYDHTKVSGHASTRGIRVECL